MRGMEDMQEVCRVCRRYEGYVGVGRVCGCHIWLPHMTGYKFSLIPNHLQTGDHPLCVQLLTEDCKTEELLTCDSGHVLKAVR